MVMKERLWNSNYCKVMTANFTLFFAFYLLTPLLPILCLLPAHSVAAALSQRDIRSD